MELLERDDYLETIQRLYHLVSSAEGHTVFVMGEAGIGKTALINTFLKQVDNESHIYIGACESLFTPTPLGPLYDIARNLSPDFWELLRTEADRASIFTTLIQELEKSVLPVVLVFEDVHWADEATLDLIKFLTRRIIRFKCLFLLSFREDEVGRHHPLRLVMGELPHQAVTRLHIQPLSKTAVHRLAEKAGFAGEEVYRLTQGNPFFVNEILASYSQGIPENIKDSVLSVFNRLDPAVKTFWELIAIIPNRIENWLLKKVAPGDMQILETCFQKGILKADDRFVFFKHELFRLAIEGSLSPHRRIMLNKQLLDILLERRNPHIELARLVHHAKNACENETVAKLALEAAPKAASLGAHIEAADFYMTAITYANDLTSEDEARLYEAHAYECYLTNQILEAINSQKKALELWREKQHKLKEGNALRFLSRLWWFQGNRKQSETFALEAIAVLENESPTRERAWAYSNLAQLKMLSDNLEQAIDWSGKAIDLAHKLEDQEILCHALNNMGAICLTRPDLYQKGETDLNQSLSIALDQKYQEHVARAYTNLGSVYVLTKNYQKAWVTLKDGIAYCEERDLDSWTYYMLSWKARSYLEQGYWEEATTIARDLLKNPRHPSIVRIGALVVLGKLFLRKGESGALDLLKEAATLASPTLEAQRIVPVAVALLEYQWIYSNTDEPNEVIELACRLIRQQNNPWYVSELLCWMHRATGNLETIDEIVDPYQSEMQGNWQKAARQWQELGCPYEQAIALSVGTEHNQKQALTILNELGGSATSEMLKQKMRVSGVKNIPRGPRPSTRENPAQLTTRQIDVLQLLQKGLHNQEIADKLFISPKTVDHHISAILSKLEVDSRVKAVVEASRLGILK